MRSMGESEIQSGIAKFCELLVTMKSGMHLPFVALILGCLEICLLFLSGHGIPDSLTRAVRNQYCSSPTSDHGKYVFLDI